MNEEIKDRLEKKILSSKDAYYLKNEEKKLNKIVKEYYKQSDREVHFPFDREYNPKYKNIKTIEYIGFKRKLPRGMSPTWQRGFGFTKTLNAVGSFIDDELKLEKLIILYEGEDSIDKEKGVICITRKTLDSIFVTMKLLLDTQSEKKKKTARNELSRYFSKEILVEKEEYIKGTLSNFLKELDNEISNFSEIDVGSLFNLVEKMDIQKELIDKNVLIKTKKAVEIYYIEDVISQYNKLMQQKTETNELEKKWQSFFNMHNWIFSYILSLPVIIEKKEAYVGGKKVSNTNGKLTDFLISNELTYNVAFIEIKTHKTELVRKGTYRGEDVYAVSDHLTGAMNQVLNQKDNFQKEFYSLKAKSGADFDTLNSKCVIIAGSIGDLEDGRLESFELFRGNSKDILIITFDELLKRIEKVKELISEKE
jgi:hypothetical protein